MSKKRKGPNAMHLDALLQRPDPEPAPVEAGPVVNETPKAETEPVESAKIDTGVSGMSETQKTIRTVVWVVGGLLALGMYFIFSDGGSKSGVEATFRAHSGQIEQTAPVAGSGRPIFFGPSGQVYNPDCKGKPKGYRVDDGNGRTFTTCRGN